MANDKFRGRVPFKRTVKYGEDELSNYGWAYELSDDAIGIYTDKLLDTGMNLTIEIMLQSEFIKAAGQVIGSYQNSQGTTYKTGVKLTDYPEKLRKTYKRIIITRHAKTFY